MGVLQRFERRLGGMVEGMFARAFKSEVQPVEVAATLQRELDERAAVVGRDRILVPNHFVVELGDHDYDRLAPYEKPLTHELGAMVREHAEDQRYTFVGPVDVKLVAHHHPRHRHVQGAQRRRARPRRHPASPRPARGRARPPGPPVGVRPPSPTSWTTSRLTSRTRPPSRGWHRRLTAGCGCARARARPTTSNSRTR